MRQGYQLYQEGWYGPAMGRFRQAALVMPSSPSPLLWQARSAMKVGRYSEARQALERAIALAPASPAAREALVMLDAFK
jgi:Flp pilus assembly protein TadD